jgi:hypothetical protein
MRKALIMAGLAGLSVTAYGAKNADGWFFATYYVTGDTYRLWPHAQRTIYVTGLLEGFLAAPFFSSGDDHRVTALEHCLSSMGGSSNQITAIVDRYVDAHPVEWGAPMQSLTDSALGETCKKIGSPLN